MLKVLPQVVNLPLVLRLQPVINLTDDQFFALCQMNRDLRIERTAQGELEVMPPTGGETGNRNSELNFQLRGWAKRDSTGVAFDSSTGFKLPNGATRSPDAAWVQRSRLAGFTREQKRTFLPLAPDFVMELWSPSDNLEFLQVKMQEYRENGVQVGWLIAPEERRVYIYRPQRPVECLEQPVILSGEPELPGFVLHLPEIWEPGL
jgi:Uma2 family endonuclease